MRKVDFSLKRARNFSNSPYKLTFWSICRKMLLWQWSYWQMFCSLYIMKKFLIHHLTLSPILLALDRRKWYFLTIFDQKYHFLWSRARNMGLGVKWYIKNFFIYILWRKHLSRTSFSEQHFSRYWPKCQFRRAITEISGPFL